MTDDARWGATDRHLADLRGDLATQAGVNERQSGFNIALVDTGRQINANTEAAHNRVNAVIVYLREKNDEYRWGIPILACVLTFCVLFITMYAGMFGHYHWHLFLDYPKWAHESTYVARHKFRTMVVGIWVLSFIPSLFVFGVVAEICKRRPTLPTVRVTPQPPAPQPDGADPAHAHLPPPPPANNPPAGPAPVQGVTFPEWSAVPPGAPPAPLQQV